MRENIYKISLLPRQEKRSSMHTADQRKGSLRRAAERFKEVADRKQGISAVSVGRKWQPQHRSQQGDLLQCGK